VSVRIDLAALHQTRWHEYALRFFFGGAITLASALIAMRYGPVLAGLFLAFPAIFPASATLLQKHQRKKKARSGIMDANRGRKAAALDARGAAMGSIGLAAFGLLVWQLLEAWNAALCLFAALAVWFATAILIWRASKIRHAHHRRLPSRPGTQ
jgi:Protein of unknown function (DUF3147)